MYSSQNVYHFSRREVNLRAAPHESIKNIPGRPETCPSPGDTLGYPLPESTQANAISRDKRSVPTLQEALGPSLPTSQDEMNLLQGNNASLMNAKCNHCPSRAEMQTFKAHDWNSTECPEHLSPCTLDAGGNIKVKRPLNVSGQEGRSGHRNTGYFIVPVRMSMEATPIILRNKFDFNCILKPSSPVQVPNINKCLQKFV